MAQISFCLSLQHTGLLPLAGYCDTFVENLITVLFWTDKIKAAHGEKIFIGIKVYFTHNIEGFVILCDIALFLLKSSI